MPAAPSRLQIATRIHLMLLRELGQGVAVEQLLTHDHYARDVLLVCDALRGSELAQLADDFRRLTAQQRQHAMPRHMPAPVPDTVPAPLAAMAAPRVTMPDALAQGTPGHVLQPTDWSVDTSGFGLTRPPPRQEPRRAPDQPERRAGWLQRLRGG
jgi:hypothetical protein